MLGLTSKRGNDDEDTNTRMAGHETVARRVDLELNIDYLPGLSNLPMSKPSR